MYKTFTVELISDAVAALREEGGAEVVVMRHCLM